MNRAIFALRQGSHDRIDDIGAARCLELLVGLSTPEPKHPPVIAALSRLVELTANQFPGIAALADWWRLVAAGLQSGGQAWALPEDLDPGILDFMARARDRSASESEPLLQKIIKHRMFEEAREGLSRSLEYSDTDTTKFQAEVDAWDEMVADLRGIMNKPGAAIPKLALPEIDEGTARKAMKKYGVQPGSPRWKYFLRRIEEVKRCRDLMARRQGDWTDIPAELDESLSNLRLPEPTSAVGLAVRAVLLPIFQAVETTTASTTAFLGEVAESASQSERDWLACLAEPWAQTVRPVIAHLIGSMDRLAEIREQIDWFGEQKIDVDLVLIHLEDGNLAGAEAEIEEVESRRRSSERKKSLASQIGSLYQSIQDEKDEPFISLGGNLREIGRELSDETVDVSYEKFHELGRQVEQARRDRNIAELEGVRDDFARLGSRPNETELSLLINDLKENPSRPVPIHILQDFRIRLEQFRDEAERRARRIMDEIRRRVDASRQDLEAPSLTGIEALLDSADRALQSNDPLTAESEGQRARDLLERVIVPHWTSRDGEAALLEHLTAFIRQSTGFAERDVRRVHVALKTRRFVILSGLTGSGKSTMARLFAEAFHATAENGRFVRIAVRPNWVDQSDVLGYVNPMSNAFEPGWMATLMRACEKEPNLPFFCLLDEMNLAPVEQYLADVLSAMEEAYASDSKVLVQMYSPGAQPVNASDWPSALPFPPNLFLFGTVNIDESTRGLSDRVIDRANMIQLSLEIGREHHSIRPRERQVNRRQVRMRDWLDICVPQGTDLYHEFLVEIADVFTQMRIGLGVRSHFEMERFMANAAGVLDAEDAIDLALLQRAIPKIRGFKRELAPGLARMRELAQGQNADRTVSVLDDWLDASVSDDSYIDGTDARVGLVTSY